MGKKRGVRGEGLEKEGEPRRQEGDRGEEKMQAHERG